MTEKLSIKITIISFALMLGVVLAHATNISFDTENKGIVWFIQHLYLEKLSNIIVTTFFFISGFLFFMSINIKNSVKLNEFKAKINKRLKTLGIPYVFWCIFWFLFIYIIQFLPYIKDSFSLPLHQMSFFQKFYNLILEPINYQFWFLRELILYVLISPLLYIIIKYLKYYVLIFLFIASLFSTSLIAPFGVSIYKFLMLFFFLLGAYVALNNIRLSFKVKHSVVFLMFFSWIILSGFMLYLEAYFIEISWVTKLIKNLLILLGCFSCWLLYDVLDKKFNFKYKSIYAFGFFIYAVHGIPILILKKAVLSYFSLSQIQLIALYFFSFIFITILCIVIAYLLKIYIPKLYYLSTGNR